MHSKSATLLLFLGLFALIPLAMNGQYKVTRVQGQAVAAAGDGFYYALPRTVLQVDLTVEKIAQVRGPLADYAENYLGMEDYIVSDKNLYRLLQVNVETRYEADPDHRYYVEFPAERSKGEKLITFQLSELGTLLAADHEKADERQPPAQVDQTIIVTEGSEDFQYHPDYHRKKRIDTIRRRITIDTVSIERFLFSTSWVDKSAEDRADEAALKIAEIREARFNLLTGYQEINYGESMKYMDRQLTRMEKEYLELFLGKEVKTWEHITVYYLPEKNSWEAVLLPLPGNDAVEIAVTPSGSTSSMPEATPEKPNSLYYRIPEMAEVTISHGNKVHYRKSMAIGQLGVVAATPLDDTRSQFDPATGSLIRIVRE